MTEASTSLHEPLDLLRPETLEARRGIVSLLEEFEAIDWYDQRIDATEDPQLKAILAHNRDEEKEHAMMALEWLRRRDPVLDQQMRTYLFTEGDIVGPGGSAATEAAPESVSGIDESLGIGSLRSEV